MVTIYLALDAFKTQYKSNILVQYKTARASRSCDKKLLQVLNFKLKTYGSRSYSYIAPPSRRHTATNIACNI